LFGREVPVPLLAGVGVVGVVLLALWARRRSPTAQAEAAEPEAFQAAQQALGAAAGGQASYADAAYNLEIQARQQELGFRQGQFERETALETAQVGLQERILNWAQGKGSLNPHGKSAIKCPSGTPHFDPSTGQVYCRREESHGFFGDLLQGAFGSPSLGGAIGQVGRAYIPGSTGSIQPTPGGF
jgi:hypothetical protein